MVQSSLSSLSKSIINKRIPNRFAFYSTLRSNKSTIFFSRTNLGTRFLSKPNKLILNTPSFLSSMMNPILNKRFYAASAEKLTPSKIFDRIRSVLEEYEKVDPSKITLEANFESDLKLDSLDVVEVLLAIEEEFQIEIPDHHLDEIRNIKQAVDYINLREDAI